MKQGEKDTLCVGSDFFDAFAESISCVGTPAFDVALLSSIQHLALVDHLTILTFQAAERFRMLGLASRTSVSIARSLTRDYVARDHVNDPNYDELIRTTRSKRVIFRRHDFGRLKASAYQRRFYTGVGIIDKVSFIWRANTIAYYVNLYRTIRTGPYAAEEARALAVLAKLIPSIVQLHGARLRLDTEIMRRHQPDLTARLVDLLGAKLAVQEAAVLSRIMMGLNTEGIASDLGLAPSSVITYRKRAYGKLGISTQAELFSRCLQAFPKLSI